jgi:hypothetical protein
LITLNIQKCLIRLGSWSDLELRPGFVRELNPDREELGSIIGRYVEKSEVRCGLTNCHQPHRRGYVVATKSVLETNIGKDCGKSYFGVEFEEMSKKFDRDITAAERREFLWSFSYEAAAIADSLHAKKFEVRGANWINSMLSRLKTPGKGVPDIIVRAINEMAKERSNEITIQRIATEDEISVLEAAENRAISRPHYVEDVVGILGGIDTLYPENDLRQLVILDVESHLKEFSNVDIDSLGHDELSYWSTWAGAVPSSIEKIDRAMTSGRTLLGGENLKPLLLLLADKDDVSNFRKFLREIDA